MESVRSAHSCPSMKKDIWDAYPELIHYTGPNGLDGILRTQTLWATHAAFLNDATELGLFRKRLPEFLHADVENALLALSAASDSYRLAFVQEGGTSVVATRISGEWAQLMHDTLIGTDGEAPNIEFYIASFCTAPSDQKQVSAHGLLSQWRGYGREGGYALVFDTGGFNDLLLEETRRWQCQITFGDVAYENDSQDVVITKMGDDLESIARAIGEWVKNPSKAPENTFRPFISCAARYKHWGFYEEHEIRIIVSVSGERISKATSPVELEKLEKPRHHVQRHGVEVPCLHLFERTIDGAKRSLPISRIIVGPHRDQERRHLGVKSLLAELGLTIPVTKSAIPYVERT
jgi:hypothetical protein